MPRLQIEAESITRDQLELQNVRLSLDGGNLEVEVDGLRTGDSGWQANNVAFLCQLGAALDEPCQALTWTVDIHSETQSMPGGWTIPVEGEFQTLQFNAQPFLAQSTIRVPGLAGTMNIGQEEGELNARVGWKNQPLQEFPDSPWTPAELAWVRTGTHSASFRLPLAGDGQQRLRGNLSIRDLSFDSPDGRFAGESLSMQSSVLVNLDPGTELSARIRGELGTGELLLNDFYTSLQDFSVRFATRLQMEGDLLKLNRIRVDDGRSVELEGDITLDLANAELKDYRVNHVAMYFPEAFQRYLASLAAPLTLDELTVTGSLLWTGSSQGGVFDSGVLDIVDLTVVDTQQNRFAITGLDAHVRPGDDYVESSLSWQGLLLERVNLGGGKATVDADEQRVSLKNPLALDVLDGRVVIEELGVRLPTAGDSDSEPDISLQVALEKLSMLELTDALGWPSFAGEISGQIPGVTLDDGVLAVDGEIVFNVFDGELRLDGLSIERPFGVLPSLAGNVEAYNLDLQQLTQVFSFGRISGRLDGYVRDLRMLDWQPVAFDAWFGTPDRQQGKNEISRNAVNSLTSIGGGGATAALTGPVLKLFSKFSYRRLGLGCRLQNYVCEVRGLDDSDPSVLIMEGAGIPKIMIRAYNRQLDWPQMVANLSAASSGEDIRIGDG